MYIKPAIEHPNALPALKHMQKNIAPLSTVFQVTVHSCKLQIKYFKTCISNNKSEGAVLLFPLPARALHGLD